jgi:hypothetical protein
MLKCEAFGHISRAKLDWTDNLRRSANWTIFESELDWIANNPQVLANINPASVIYP